MAVFVLNKKKKPLMPCSEKRARLLLERGRAVVDRVYPFTIRIKDRVEGKRQPVRIKIDPGSKMTGIAAVSQKKQTKQKVIWLAEVVHNGQQIRDRLTQRRGFRKGRRNRNLRYRAVRFLNRLRKKGWLPPSLTHRVETTLSWVNRLNKYLPLTAISFERVKFDTQALLNPEITGVAYQKGTLFGYEVREYLLEKWGRKCVYCEKRDLPLEIDHIQPKSSGGSDRVSNLALACKACNQKKGPLPLSQFLKSKPNRLKTILRTTMTPLKDAAAVNSTRSALYTELVKIGFPIETATGGRTKWNRCRLGIPKTHALDAACVGNLDVLEHWRQPVLIIKSAGRGSYKRTRLNRHGFPRGYLMREKTANGFQTGDLICASVPSGKKTGNYYGRVAIRASGNFNIQTKDNTVQGVSHRFCKLLQRAEGYSYYLRTQQQEERRFLPDLKDGISTPSIG